VNVYGDPVLKVDALRVPLNRLTVGTWLVPVMMKVTLMADPALRTEGSAAPKLIDVIEIGTRPLSEHTTIYQQHKRLSLQQQHTHRRWKLEQ